MKNKLFKILLLILAVSIVTASGLVYADNMMKSGVIIKLGETKAIVNGEYKTLDVPAEIVGERTLVPLRFCTEALGADVRYIDETQTAVIKKGNVTLEMIPGQSVYKVNGELLELDAPALLKNGRILVPVRVVSESFEIPVGWYDELKIVTLGILDNETAIAEYLKKLF